MLLILVLCVVLGYFVERGRRQRLVVKAIKEAGGKVAYDYECVKVKGVYQSGRQPREPKWLLRLAGIDFFHEAKLVGIVQRDFSEEEMYSTHRPVNPLLSKLRDLPGLRLLGLDGGFNDAEIEQLRGLTRLEELQVIGADLLTEEGIANLSNLTNLKSLGLSCPVTDKGLSHLSGLRNLETLSLLCMGPHGEAENYRDGSKPITGEGLKYLRGMTKLRTLVIDSDQIGDEGLSHLEGLDKLESLSLSLIDPHLTDACLRTLAKIPRLKKLCLDDDDVITPEAIASFKKSRPDVQLIR